MNRARWRCDECDHVSTTAEMLRAANPFDEDDTIIGCPHCKRVSAWTELCDECDQQVTCGTPTKDGYRRTCHMHRPKEIG